MNRIGRITAGGQITELGIPPPVGEPGEFRGPSQIVAGTDGALWFLSNFDSYVARLTTDGQVSALSMGFEQAERIAAAPEGGVWFTDSDGEGVSRVAPDLTDQFFAASFLDPSPITAGPDGAMWFATADGLGRITTAGSLTEMPLPGGRHADGIAFGSDGALWFTDDRLNRISRITVADAVRRRRISPTGAQSSWRRCSARALRRPTPTE